MSTPATSTALGGLLLGAFIAGGCGNGTAVVSFPAPVYQLDGAYDVATPVSRDLRELCEEEEISPDRALALGLAASSSCWRVASGCSHALEFRPSETAVAAAGTLPPGGVYSREPIVPAQNVLVDEVLHTSAVGCEGGVEDLQLRRALTSLALLTYDWSAPGITRPDVDRFVDEAASEWRLQATTAGSTLDILPPTGGPAVWTGVLTPQVPRYFPTEESADAN